MSTIIMQASNHVYTTLLEKDNVIYIVKTLHKGINKNTSFYREFDDYNKAKECFMQIK